jgi:hypothetical protein
VRPIESATLPGGLKRQQINMDRVHVNARIHRKINAETLLSQAAESYAAVKWGYAE